MTSQILAIFYLNDLDYYIKEKLKIKYYIRYQDDFCLFHPSKQYLKECLEKIKEFLKKEKLELNKKTRIYNERNQYIFLGRTIKNKKGNYRNKNKKINLKSKQYKIKNINLYSYLMSKNSLKNKKIN